MAAVHLIVGYMGFGKTVLARRLERELPAVRLTHDEFMCRLFGRDMPEPAFRAAWKKVDDLIWMLTEQTVRAGCNVILDYGFWTRESRQAARQRALETGAEVIVHQLLCSKETARRRVLQRTDNNDDSLLIDNNCFEKFWPQYQPVADDENYRPINYQT